MININEKNIKEIDDDNICYCCGRESKNIISIYSRKICRECGMKHFVYTSKIKDYLNRSYWGNNEKVI